MKTTGYVGLIAGLAVVCTGSWVLANGFRNPPAGAEALGRVGGKIAQVDDASAVEHNPANLAEIKEAQVMGSVTIINTGTKFHSPMGTASTEDSWKVLPNFFVALPSSNHNFTAGLGITTPFGQSTVWDKTSAFRYTAPYSAELTVININPTLATKLGEKVSVAAGLDMYLSRLDMKQVLPWSLLTGGALPDGTAHLQGDGAGVGGNVAATYHPTKAQSLALTYRSPVKVDYDGDGEFSGAQAVGMSPSSDFESSIEFPTIVGLGYGIELSDTVRIEADVEWIEFSRYDSLTLDAGNSNPLLNGPTSPNPRAPLVVRQNWKDTWTFGAGADWKVAEALTLRAGYIFLQSPVPEETLAPTLPDADRHVVTLGAGWHRGPDRIDLAYGYSIIGDRDVMKNQNPAYNGTYETTSHLMSVSYVRSF
ncbi:MAG: outer membrane protein transport protein [bacterium]